jgi:hypothetical protein
MDDWELVHKGHHIGELWIDTPYQSKIQLDFSVQASSLLIGVKSTTARATWKMGCWASAQLHFTVPELSEYKKIFSVARQACLLNQLTLFNLPSFDSYYISVSTPWWLREINLEVWSWTGSGFADPAVERALEKIEEKIEGKEIVLRKVVYSEIREGNQVLIVSSFTEKTPYEKFEVGRFRSVFNSQTLSDPIIQVSPFQLVAIFTGKEPVLPETVKVRVFL